MPVEGKQKPGRFNLIRVLKIVILVLYIVLTTIKIIAISKGGNP